MQPDASFDPAPGQAAPKPTEVSRANAAAPLRVADIGVCGSVLVEAQSSPRRLELTLYGRLDAESALAVERDFLAPADLAGRTTFLDLTHLDDVDPLGFRVLADRQHSAHAEGMRLFIRIVAEQASRVIDAHVDVRRPLS